VVVTALRNWCFIVRTRLQIEKASLPHGRKAYIIIFGIYTQPFSRYLRKTTRIRLMIIYKPIYIILFFFVVNAFRPRRTIGAFVLFVQMYK